MEVKHWLLAVLVSGLLMACESGQTPPKAVNKLQETPRQTIQNTENQRANAFFEQAYNEMLARKPIDQSNLGIKDNQHKWNDFSDAHEEENLRIYENQLATLKNTIDYEKLDQQTKLSYDLFVYSIGQKIEKFRYRYHTYPIQQMFGIHALLPSVLINIHKIDDRKDANAYISRLKKIDKALAQVTENLKTRAEKNIIIPKFIFPYVINDCENIIKGRPFDTSESDSTLLADFKNKVAKLEVPEEEKNLLTGRASQALLDSVQTGYRNLITYLQELETLATNDAGVWKLPEGEVFYNMALRHTTTTDMTADEIHQLGLREVERIHWEMKKIKKQVGFRGSLQDFFKFMRTDKQFIYPDTQTGKDRYMKEAKSIIDTMRSRLDELFITKPKADMKIKAVEAFREKSAGKAFYRQPSMDGSRPATYYANLFRMQDMPTYEMEALAYHEGIPGHHMQIAIAMELENIPKFRKFNGFTAYTEGWGLYAELIPKEMGLYQNPYSDFGRLAMELWRACRLVVDTGIHAKKWTREQAIDYQVQNTPASYESTVKAIERYIIMPSQATAYKIGMLKILSLRDYARDALGDRFDLREFHDTILKNGAVPLHILEKLVHDWVDKKTKGNLPASYTVES